MSGRVRLALRWAVTAGFFAAVVWLLHRQLREVDPHEIAAALRGLSAAQVGAALALTAVAYAVVASYDRLAARHAGVRLPASLGFAIPFVSYAFNFNVGAIVGALGFRYRLYSRQGVGAEQIAAIAACSIVTNWCGCLTVLAAMLIADPSALALGWSLAPTPARLLGAVAFVPVAAYLAATRLRKRPLRIRGGSYRLPGFRFALAQLALGSAYWLIVPLVLWTLQPPGIALPYTQIAATYGLAALGGVVVRVPAGLGVLEAVYLQVFDGSVRSAAILAMLIAWRAVFLLAPLAVASGVLAALELRSGARRPERRSFATR